MPSEPLFRVVDVSGWENVEEEPSGAATKLWLGQPDTEPEVRWLFKTVTIKGGHVHGEDWAEKTASHLGALLGLPCAQVELAAWHGYDGCISRNLRPHSTDMQNSAAPGYVHRSRGKEHPGHSLENIRMALEGAAPPPGCVLPFEASAFDVFAGYVVFDRMGGQPGPARSQLVRAHPRYTVVRPDAPEWLL